MAPWCSTGSASNKRIGTKKPVPASGRAFSFPATEGFRYMSSLNAYFSLGTDMEVTEVEVHWPSGIADVITAPSINGTLTVVEGLSTGIVAPASTPNTSLFPNPVIDVLNVSGAAELHNNRVVVLDVTGKRVMEGTLRNGQLDVSGLTSGVYMISVTANGTTVQPRFTKQ
ncbi:MAG: T9SS type A sorting domain-containing protein [Flavobacteriales bacterium]